MFEGYVYFIRQKNENLFKIGISHGDISLRLKAMQVGTPHELEVFGSVISDDPRKLEKELHNHFRDYHIRGEWFKISQQQVEDYLNQNSNSIPDDVIEIKQEGKIFYYIKSTGKIFMDSRSVKKILGDFYLTTCFASNRGMLAFSDGILGIDYDLIMDDFNQDERLKVHKEILMREAIKFE